MLYIGMDVHSKWMTVRGFDSESGEIVEMDRLPNDIDSLESYFGSLDGPLCGAMESGTNSWYVYRILEPFFEKLYVVDPATVWGKLVRRGAKTDRRDARALAIKMYRGELEPLYVPDERTQDLRALSRGKIDASRRMTRLVSEIGSLLKSWGVIVDCSLLSEKGQELIESSRLKLKESNRSHSLMVLDHLLKELALAQETENELEEAIKKEVACDEDCQMSTSARLCTTQGRVMCTTWNASEPLLRFVVRRFARPHCLAAESPFLRPGWGRVCETFVCSSRRL